MAIARKIEAEPKLSRLLDELELGGEAEVTRSGAKVGRLVREEAGPADPRRAEQAVRALRDMRRRLALGPFDLEEFKRMRDDGRA